MRPLFLLLILPLAGCLTTQQRQSDATNRENAIARRNAAAAHAWFNCDSATQCDKAFRLTKIYVQQNSSMKIQTADDTIIQTYNPIKVLDSGITARKIPGKGSTERIELFVTCNDSEFDRSAYCPNRQAQIYEGFRAFLESRMD